MRRIFSIFLALVLMFTLTACGDATGQGSAAMFHCCQLNCPIDVQSNNLEHKKIAQSHSCTFAGEVPEHTENHSSAAVLRDCSQLEPVLQNPELPNGCELASLTTLLRYEGFQVSFNELNLPKQEFSYDRNICYGPDPEDYYVGEPSSATGGWYCFEGPVLLAANAYLAKQGSPLRAHILTSTSLSGLETWLEDGTPVAVWFTTNYSLPQYSSTFSWILPSGEKYWPYVNLHCVVLIDADEDVCTLADPIQGITQIDRDIFETIYTAMGMRALALTE